MLFLSNFRLSILFFFFFTGVCFSQNKPGLKIENDSILVSIQKQLPIGWNMFFEDATLIIEKKGPFKGIRMKEYVADTHPNAAPPLPDSLNRKSIHFSLTKTNAIMDRSERNSLIDLEDQIDSLLETLYIKHDGKKIMKDLRPNSKHS